MQNMWGAVCAGNRVCRVKGVQDVYGMVVPKAQL